MPIVTLTPTDWSMALHLASERAVDSLRHNRKDRCWDKDNWTEELGPHVLGAAAEIAFAKWSGCYPTYSVQNFSGGRPDMTYNGLSIEVRGRSKSYYELMLRDNDDPARVYVLVRGFPPQLSVVGWIMGEDGMKTEYRANHGGFGEAFFIPDSSLNPMEDLVGQA